MTVERPKHLLWRANLLTSDLRTIPLLRLVHALASYEHHVSVVLYDNGLSLLMADAHSEISGMIAAFPLYDVDIYVVADAYHQVPHHYHDQVQLLAPTIWTDFLADIALLTAPEFAFMLPSLPGMKTPIDGLL